MTWVVFLVRRRTRRRQRADRHRRRSACWWVTAIAGLLILVRWLPTAGSTPPRRIEDTWSEGPGLSVLAHVGMLVGVLVFTWAYLTSAV